MSFTTFNISPVKGGGFILESQSSPGTSLGSGGFSFSSSSNSPMAPSAAGPGFLTPISYNTQSPTVFGSGISLGGNSAWQSPPNSFLSSGAPSSPSVLAPIPGGFIGNFNNSNKSVEDNTNSSTRHVQLQQVYAMLRDLLSLDEASSAKRPVDAASPPHTLDAYDPSRSPKRATTAFFLYAEAKRAEIKAANPNLLMTEVGLATAKGWKNLSDAEKQIYIDKAELDKKRYLAERIAFEENLKRTKIPFKGQFTPTKKKPPKKEKIRRKQGTQGIQKDANAPKRGMSAYMFYALRTRDQLKKESPDASFGEVARLLSEKWMSLTAEAKKPFEELAQRDLERYQAEIQAYESKASRDQDDEDEDDSDAEEGDDGGEDDHDEDDRDEDDGDDHF